jgi:light-regulated signal transduction histidine kinase (bacteriophytochrome)
VNVLEDFAGEKGRLEDTQRAVLNILDDFDLEKIKVEAANRELLREVGERREAERALRDKTEALRRSNEELEQFAYVASHDLQEPLRMVASYVQLLARRYQGAIDAQADKYIHYAVDGAKRMQALINALLDYSRVGREMRLGRVDLGRLLDQTLATLSGPVEESGAEVTRDPLPEVVGDASQLGQLLQNLIGNALKFRRPGVPARVHVSAARRGPDLVFAVRDNGIGVDPGQLSRLFVIFQRLHTRAEYPGTGIGLAICKKVVEHHGGRIWAESEPGSGSTFFFTLPARSGT